MSSIFLGIFDRNKIINFFIVILSFRKKICLEQKESAICPLTI